jgi:hypothetical protein
MVTNPPRSQLENSTTIQTVRDSFFIWGTKQVQVTEGSDLSRLHWLSIPGTCKTSQSLKIIYVNFMHVTYANSFSIYM